LYFAPNNIIKAPCVSDRSRVTGIISGANKTARDKICDIEVQFRTINRTVKYPIKRGHPIKRRALTTDSTFIAQFNFQRYDSVLCGTFFSVLIILILSRLF